MQKVYIGYVQGVHGLRGDLKIKCKFESPEKVFNPNTKILLNYEEHTITSTKFYKGFYLTTIDNIKDINKVEKYKGYEVFVDRNILNLSETDYILDDLFGMEIIMNDTSYGNVKNILDNGKYNILEIDYKKNYMIPLIDEYVEKVDLENSKIICKNIEGLML